jgi:hypothetical protein
MSELQFKCSFKPVGEWSGLSFEDKEKTKSGRYTVSVLPVRGYGSKVWAVVAYIDVDYKSLRSEGYSDKQIVEGCVNFLNKPLTRRHRKPRYGELAPNWTCVLEDKDLISVCLLVDQKNNKNFWGKGWKGWRK